MMFRLAIKLLRVHFKGWIKVESYLPALSKDRMGIFEVHSDRQEEEHRDFTI